MKSGRELSFFHSANLAYGGSIHSPLVVDGAIVDDLYQLCKIVADARKIALPDRCASVADWNDWAQQNLLRPKNLDHRDMLQLSKSAEHAELMPYFKKLSLTQEFLPEKTFYSSWVIFGGSIWDSRDRIAYVKKLWDSGYRADHIIYINGLRLIGAGEAAEKWGPNKEMPRYQHEAAAMVWDELIDNKEMRSKFTIMTIDPVEAGRLVNTADTLKALFEKYSHEKSILFISNAPYGLYQAAMVDEVKAELAISDVTTETVSPAIQRDIPTIIFLDTLARRLYSEFGRLQSQQRLRKAVQ